MPHPPTLRVDTFPPRKDHIHPHATCLTPIDLPGRRPSEDPGAPLLRAVCVSPSSQQSPGSGAANSEATRQDGKNTCGKCLKLHAANLSTWRAPRNSENATKNDKNTKSQRNRQKRHRRIPRIQTPGTTNTRRASTTPQPTWGGHGAGERARSRTSNQKAGRTPQPRARGTTRRTEGRKAATRGPPRAATRRTSRNKSDTIDRRNTEDSPEKGEPQAEGKRWHNRKHVHDRRRQRPGEVSCIIPRRYHKHLRPQHNFGAYDPFPD